MRGTQERDISHANPRVKLLRTRVRVIFARAVPPYAPGQRAAKRAGILLSLCQRAALGASRRSDNDVARAAATALAWTG